MVDLVGSVLDIPTTLVATGLKSLIITLLVEFNRALNHMMVEPSLPSDVEM